MCKAYVISHAILLARSFRETIPLWANTFKGMLLRFAFRPNYRLALTGPEGVSAYAQQWGHTGRHMEDAFHTDCRVPTSL
jgi:hypothetical protein